jgi:hypothetical protein
LKRGVAIAEQDVLRNFAIVIPESGVKIESSALNRFQPMNLAQDAIGQIL